MTLHFWIPLACPSFQVRTAESSLCNERWDYVMDTGSGKLLKFQSQRTGISRLREILSGLDGVSSREIQGLHPLALGEHCTRGRRRFNVARRKYARFGLLSDTLIIDV